MLKKWFGVAHHKQSGLAPVAIILIIAGVLVLAGGVYFWQKSKAPNQIACPMDAKICPDGSSVGRTGPNCEFTACPLSTSTPSIPTSTPVSKSTSSVRIPNWEIYNNYGFEVQYPPFLKVVENPPTPEKYLYSVSFENPLANQSTPGQKIVFNVSIFKDSNQLQSAFKLLTLEDQGKVMVGGYQAKKLFVAIKYTEATIYTIALKNMSLIFYGSDYSEISKNDISKILSTFKFTQL